MVNEQQLISKITWRLMEVHEDPVHALSDGPNSLM